MATQERRPPGFAPTDVLVLEELPNTSREFVFDGFVGVVAHHGKFLAVRRVLADQVLEPRLRYDAGSDGYQDQVDVRSQEPQFAFENDAAGAVLTLTATHAEDQLGDAALCADQRPELRVGEDVENRRNRSFGAGNRAHVSMRGFSLLTTSSAIPLCWAIGPLLSMKTMLSMYFFTERSPIHS
ncbi:MAG TPA: hypothetical protein VFH06_05525 [Candidatus Saccharimonadales bacterium]|nr:hypothetical protein [Candidatus Saccharimonadales bacterium]